MHPLTLQVIYIGTFGWSTCSDLLGEVGFAAESRAVGCGRDE